MYPPDPSTPDDQLCNEAPPCPASLLAWTRQISYRNRPAFRPLYNAPQSGSLLERLLALDGEWTAAEAAEEVETTHWQINQTIRRHPAMFDSGSGRRDGNRTLQTWRARPASNPSFPA